MKQRSAASAVLPLLVLVGATIACDRVTKHVAETTLVGSPARSFLAGAIRLEYVENAGAFLSLGADWPHAVRTGLLIVGNGALLIVLTVLAVRRRWPSATVAGFALFVAGGASNLVDRAARGVVVDFINVGWGSLRTGIFNVADVAIMVGVGLVILGGFGDRKRNRTSV